MRKWLKGEAKKISMREWQEMWTEEITGRWTRKIIPDIEKWIKRKHGELNFYMTQAMTGHGVFNKFRKTIGKASSDECWYCCGIQDTPEHTLMNCRMWEEERRELKEKLEISEGNVEIGQVMQKILTKEDWWYAFSDFCKEVMKKKEEERRKEKEEEEEEVEQRRQEEERLSTDDLREDSRGST